MSDFTLPYGIDIPDINGLKSAYSAHDDGSFEVLVSAEKLCDLLTDLTANIPEPIFFFLELPAENGDELYYLDNCTYPVIRALIKEYGSLLAGDGVCRFGFGGNESGDEIYVKLYKVTDIYCSNEPFRKKTEAVFKKHRIPQTEKLLTPWELITEKNPAVCVRAEEDNISLFDLPEMFRKAGMYKA